MSTGLATVPAETSKRFDPLRVRKDFPILSTQSHGRPLVYLDNGATTQKPRAVIDAISRYYESQNANIHRGVYELSQVATREYEESRGKVRRFINAAEDAECLFTRGTTEGINLVAASGCRAFLKKGDEVLVSALEHHSNIVPWQIACECSGAKLRVIPMNDAGELEMGEYERMLSGRTRFVTVNHVSNSLGTVNPVAEMTRMAHAVGALVLVDGAQWVAHHRTDVRAIDADFYAFSGHKLFGPTGIGVLYGKRSLLDRMPPWQGGGDMIKSVSFERTEYAELPNKFEAGTPDIAGAIGLGAAIDYVTSVGFESFEPHERELLRYATERLSEVQGLKIIGTAKEKAGVVSFVMDRMSAMDIGTALDLEGIAVRTGHHCCQPVMDRFCIPATTRASFAMYNTREDVDALVGAIKQIVAKRSPAKAEASAEARAEAKADVIAYPPATAPSVQAAADAIAGDVEFFDDARAKNEFILELGEEVPELFDLLKRVTPRIPGCMSEVYLVGRKRPGTADILEFVADANADIVRGLIAVLQKIYSGQRASEVVAFDIEAFFRRIGLDQFITAQRRNGLGGMVSRIKSLAAGIGK